MPTIRKVQDIKTNLLRPALTSHFEVEIGIPAGGFQKFLKDNQVIYRQDKLNLSCSETVLPGSSLATLEINNDFTGVTERHAYRRIYDDRIDLTFYVDAEQYLPIRFFETWIKYIANESVSPQPDKDVGSASRNYFYRMRYPEGSNGYTIDSLKVTKFERDHKQAPLEYRFIKAFPISVSSMPVSYESSSLLKCTVSMSYIRYIVSVSDKPPVTSSGAQEQAAFNSFAFGQDLPLEYGNFTTTNGISFSDAAKAGNAIDTQTAFSSGLNLF